MGIKEVVILLIVLMIGYWMGTKGVLSGLTGGGS